MCHELLFLSMHTIKKFFFFFWDLDYSECPTVHERYNIFIDIILNAPSLQQPMHDFVEYWGSNNELKVYKNNEFIFTMFAPTSIDAHVLSWFAPQNNPNLYTLILLKESTWDKSTESTSGTSMKIWMGNLMGT